MSVDWKRLRCEHLGEAHPRLLPPSLKLPILPAAVQEFNRLADDPEASLVDLGRVVESDCGLTAQLLRMVNSAALGLKKKASSAQQAIAVLGVRSVRLHLLAAGMQLAMKTHKSKLINMTAFWHTNLERAFVARQVAELLGADENLAFSASLLHDFLLPMLTNELFDDYLRFSETPEDVRRPLVDFEAETFGWDHARASAHVLLAWGLPDDLVCAVLWHHRGLQLLSDVELGRTAAAAVAVAGLVPDPLRQARGGLKHLLWLHEHWPEFDLPRIAEYAAQQLHFLSPAAGQHFTLQRRLEKYTAGLAEK
uniref:HDOD domain-containing protein n=1 Tax=Schlesneria paludicola TaxID=360056 RepID=A0A7C4LNT6_9PLAN